MQKQVHGGDIYTNQYKLDFSANINPFGPPDSVIRAVEKAARLSDHYPDVFCRELRSKLAVSEAVEEAWIICGNGAAELIFSAVLAEKPKKALVTAPGFAEYEQALQVVDCETVFYECRKQDGFRIREDYLDYLTDDTDMVFLCNPNNPTGLLVDPTLLERIVRMCGEKKIRLILDECFIGFTDHPEQRTMKYMLKDTKQLFLLKAFTKLYAMAGLRLGYGLTSDAGLLERMRRVVQPWSVSVPAQMAGIAALDEREYVENSCRYLTAEREYMKARLQKAGYDCYASEANYLFFEGQPGLYDTMLEEGIMIRDCSNYHGLRPGYYRIAVRTREENEELLCKLEEKRTLWQKQL